MRLIPKHITDKQINIVINLYLRNKKKQRIKEICKLPTKTIEAIIENKIPKRFKENVFGKEKLNKTIIKLVIKAMELGILEYKIAKYFKLKDGITGFIFRKYGGNNTIRTYNRAKRIKEKSDVIKEKIKSERIQKKLSYANTKKLRRKKLIEIEDKLNNKQIYIKKNYIKQNYNNKYFEDINSEQKAYWLGFIAADGCVYNTCLVFNLGIEDKKHLQKFQECIGSNYNLKYIKEDNKIFGDYIYNYRAYSLNIRSKNMTTDLKKHGITNCKTHTVCIPNINNNLIKHFIRGYFDGDGCFFNKDNKFKVHFVGNKKMLLGIKNYLENNININKNSITPVKKVFQLQYAKKDQVISILNFLYEDATIWLDRKKEKFLEALSGSLPL